MIVIYVLKVKSTEVMECRRWCVGLINVNFIGKISGKKLYIVSRGHKWFESRLLH